MQKKSSIPYILLAIGCLIFFVVFSAKQSDRDNADTTDKYTENKFEIHTIDGKVTADIDFKPYDPPESAPLTKEELSEESPTEEPETAIIDFPIVEYGSEGLQYEILSDYSGVIVTGIGDCTDSQLIIPSVYMGYRVREIASGAFEGNKTITSVLIADGVETIGANAFSGCGKLVEVFLPEFTLKTISSSAFANCINLKTLRLPATLSYIGEKAFSRCKILGYIEFGGTMDEWERIEKSSAWDSGSVIKEIYCLDGVLGI